ncbi:unnamed protein product [Vitrella brassicaformis CCMP3155]|uniref:SET domain-containing protein n=2 Tax=Vitrella brassicaformis TaxID=1169539 RepID=A0A0G4EY36_VITBC|nr:unnamed protein product [Vitrella brassicaformis CCMP3155]|eukprot:CEM04249.1 unnamed protein product [Vitrella brassicaformis CCMP3155]
MKTEECSAYVKQPLLPRDPRSDGEDEHTVGHLTPIVVDEVFSKYRSLTPFAFYCSDECRQAGQRALSVLRYPSCVPIFESLVGLSHRANNVFLTMLAILLSAVVSELDDHAASPPNKRQKTEQGHQTSGGSDPDHGGSSSTSTSKALNVLRRLVRKPIHEVLDVPEDCTAEELRRELKEESQQAISLIRQLLVCSGSMATYPWLEQEFLSEDAFDLWLGALGLNVISVKVPHPIVFFLEAINDMKDDDGAKKELIEVLAPSLCQLNRAKMAKEQQKERQDAEEGEGGNASDDDESGEASSDSSEGSDASDDDREADVLFWDWSGYNSSGDDTALLGSLSSELFPSFKGYALFPVFSLLNHSCEPNSESTYVDRNTISAFTTRDVAAGEELTISYIDNTMSLADRREELRGYGFVCTCPKCEREAAGGLLQKET